MIAQVVVPPRLGTGDLVRIVSPSAPVASLVPGRLARAQTNLRAMGYRTDLAAHVTARTGHTAGTRVERLEDLHAAFLDPEVRMILASIGGFSSHQLLEDLDAELIRRHPKILIGYSDITALLTAIHRRTGLVTFLGPAALPQFGEAGGLMPYTRRMWERVVTQAMPAGELEPSGEAVSEILAWDRDDVRPRRMEPYPRPSALRAGTAEGPILAANLGTLLLLAGTSDWPDLRGRLLFVEDDEDEKPATLDRYFTQLRQMGVYGEIAGLGVGRIPRQVGLTPEDSLAAMVLEATRGFRFPIATDLDFGHWDPMLTLPNGVRGRLDAHPGQVRVTLLEAAVF